MLPNLTGVATLTRIRLTTGFLLGPADDRRVPPILQPMEADFPNGYLVLSIYGCAWRRHRSFLVWSLSGHGDQDGCAYVLSS